MSSHKCSICRGQHSSAECPDTNKKRQPESMSKDKLQEKKRTKTESTSSKTSSSSSTFAISSSDNGGGGGGRRSDVWTEPVETDPPSLGHLVQSFERALGVFYTTLNETKTAEKLKSVVKKYSEDMQYGTSISDRLQQLCWNLTKHKKYASRLQFHRNCNTGRFPCDGCIQQASYDHAITQMHSVVREIRHEINNHRQQRRDHSQRRWNLYLSEDATDQDCEAIEERERHTKRCQTLGLPNTADANECTLVEMKREEERKIAEERERHIKRCHELGLPDTADANECTLAETKREEERKIAEMKRAEELKFAEMKKAEERKIAGERERHIKRCQKLGLPNTADANECTVVEMKRAKERKIAEDRERHVKRCQRLGLPDTADANECSVAEIKRAKERKIAEMKRVEEEQKALHDYHSLRCQALGLPLNSNIDHWKFPDAWYAPGLGHSTSLEKFGCMEKYKQSLLSYEHICDKCQKAQATIYCTNDEAYFCDTCDQNSHQDNITQKHRRENIHDMLQHVTDSCPRCKATFFPMHCPFGAGVDIDGDGKGRRKMYGSHALIPEVVAFDAQHWDGESYGIVKCCRKPVKPTMYSDDIGFEMNDFCKGCHIKCDCAIINVGCTLCCKECGELKVQYVQPKRGEYDFDVVVEKGAERFDKYQNDRSNFHRDSHSEDVVACHCENPECSKGNAFCFSECGRCTECTTAEFCASGRHCNMCGNSKCNRCNCCLLCKKEEQGGNSLHECEDSLCSDCCTFICPNCSDACKECEVVLCSRNKEGCSGFKCYECEIHCDTFCDECNRCHDCNGGGRDEDGCCKDCASL